MLLAEYICASCGGTEIIDPDDKAQILRFVNSHYQPMKRESWFKEFREAWK